MKSKSYLVAYMVAGSLMISGCERNEIATPEEAMKNGGTQTTVNLPPANSVSFIDTDLDEDQIAGTVTISKTADENAISSYVLYWGTAPGVKTGSPIADIAKSGSNPSYSLPVDTAVPVGVTHFIVYTKNDAGELSPGISLNIPDNVVKVINIFSGPSSSLPDNLIVYNNTLFFVAADTVKDRELWRYDDSLGKANRVADLNPSGDMAAGATYSTVYNNKLYFQATNGVTGEEPYVYDDATKTGPTLVHDINPVGPSYAGDFCVYAGKLYFGAEKLPGNRQLWVFDDSMGPPATEIIINPVGSAGVAHLAVHNGKLFFTARNAASGAELWYYDGSSAQAAADILPGTGGSNPDNLTVYGNDLYFSADDGVSGMELVKYDDALSTATVLDIEAGGASAPKGFAVFNNTLFFTATRTSGGNVGTELFAYSDPGSPYLAADILPGTGSGSPGYFAELQGKLYFGGNDGARGMELMVYDGSNPPYTIADINPINPSGGSDPKYLTVHNGALYFQGYSDSTKGTELIIYYEK